MHRSGVEPWNMQNLPQIVARTFMLGTIVTSTAWIPHRPERRILRDRLLSTTRRTFCPRGTWSWLSTLSASYSSSIILTTTAYQHFLPQSYTPSMQESRSLGLEALHWWQRQYFPYCMAAYRTTSVGKLCSSLHLPSSSLQSLPAASQ